MPDDGNHRDDPKGRRAALKTFAAASGVVACGAVCASAARFVVAPAREAVGAGHWIRTVPLDSLVAGEPKRVSLVADRRDAWTLERQVELGAAWLLLRNLRKEGAVGAVDEDGAVVAFSTVCPHLGCAVDKGASGVGFYCPCHDSSFDADGQRRSGPSPRGLDALATRVDDGIVMVQFQRFRQGTPEKDPI